MIDQRARDRLGGGADIDEQARAVRHQPRRRGADPRLGLGRDLSPRLAVEIVDPRRDDRPAVHPRQQGAAREQVEIAPDRLRGHPQFARQRVDRHAPGVPRQIEDALLAPGDDFGEFGRHHACAR